MDRAVRVALCGMLVLAAACRQPASRASAPPSHAQIEGTLELAGLSAPVRVVRDRFGIPHIYAANQNDLFFAQGFVQAQDRLFQMDLWRRSALGRLAEVLGANFIERDAMTRRVQYRGGLDEEWASYGPDAKAIAEAFVRGVNARVARAREHPPEAFVLAGWLPDFWSAADLLNRTDAFVESRAAPGGIAGGLSPVVAEAIQRAGAPPFFVGLAMPVRGGAAGAKDGAARDRELVSPHAYHPQSSSASEARDGSIHVDETRPAYDHPSYRYLVHLNAPGWNAMGATKPWRPGVAIGHTDRVAWGANPADGDRPQVVAEPIDRVTRVLKDTIVVKGRDEPFEYETLQTADGVVVATDRQAGQYFVLRWAGFEAGAAPEMGAPALDRASTIDEFRTAAAHWKMPARSFVVADAQGNVVTLGHQQQGDGDRSRPGPSPVPNRSQSPAMFAHPLAITDAARSRFNVGPLTRPADDQPFRAVFNPRAWDDSRAILAPGQSEDPDRASFSDLATIWSSGQLVALAFSDAAVQANAAATLTLVPGRRR